MAKPARVSEPSTAGSEQNHAPPSAQQAIEKTIDESRKRDGVQSAVQERAQVDQAMRDAGARVGPKVEVGSVVGSEPRRVLSVERFESAQARRNVWDAIAHAGTVIEDLLDPRYWSSIGPQLRQWDHIEVRCEDGSFYAELIVEDRGRRYAKCALIRHVQLRVADPEGPALPAGYAIEHKGPFSQWMVIRDGTKLRDKFGTYGAANDWLMHHLSAVSR